MLLFVLLQFQTELRKILVSLIEVAQKLLALNPDAVELFKKANGKMENPNSIVAGCTNKLKSFLLSIIN